MAIGPVVGVVSNGACKVREPYQINDLTYNGREQSPVWVDLETEFFTITNDPGPQKNAGTYYVKVKPKGLYKWSDGTKVEKTLSWIIKPRLLEDPFIVESSKKIEYNGSARYPTVHYDSAITDCNDTVSSVIQTTYSSNSPISNGSYTVYWEIINNNYVWQRNVPTIKQDIWEIVPLKVDIPVVTNTEFTYDISNKSPTVTPSSSDYWEYVIGGTDAISASAAKSYTVKIKLKNVNYQWIDGDTSLYKTFPWIIRPKKIDKPYIEGTTYFSYNGSQQSPILHGITASNSYVTMTGTTASTNSGDFTIKYTLQNNSASQTNVMWSDGTTAEHSLFWNIAPLVISKPYLSNDTFKYNGTTSYVPTILPNLTEYTKFLDIKHYYKNKSGSAVEITSSKNSSNIDHETTYYYTEISVKSGVNTSTVKNVSFDNVSIFFGDVSPSSKTVTQIKWYIDPILTNKPSLTQIEFPFSTGSTNISNYERDFVSNLMERTGDITKQYAGNYTVTYTLKGNTTEYKNVLWPDGTDTPINCSWKINNYVSVIPTPDEALTYNTTEQGPSWYNYLPEFMNLTGTNKATNAGTYTATFTSKYPTNNSVVFTDDNLTTVNSNWKINKRFLAKPYLTLYEIPYKWTAANAAEDIYISDYYQNYDSVYMTISGTKVAQDIGNYTTTFSLSRNTGSKINTNWSDSTTAAVTLNWTIYDDSIQYFGSDSWETVMEDNSHTSESRIDWDYVFTNGTFPKAMLSASQINEVFT